MENINEWEITKKKKSTTKIKLNENEENGMKKWKKRKDK